MTGHLIDPEGRCELCGRLVPIECPEPDGLSCGTYVLEVTAGEGDDVAAQIERLRASLAANDAGPTPDLDVPPDEPCPDCDGTGWASESNPGTGGGTGRDEQIAVECPRGCPPADMTEAEFMEAMDDIVEHILGTRPEPSIRSLTAHPDHIAELRARTVLVGEQASPSIGVPAFDPDGVELFAAEMGHGRAMVTYSDGSTAWMDLATGVIGERTATLPVGFGARGLPPPWPHEPANVVEAGDTGAFQARGCPADEHGGEDPRF